MKIDRSFEEALGVGPRFIMKEVMRIFCIKRDVSTENKWLIVRRPKSKPCVCMASYVSDRWNRIRVLSFPLLDLSGQQKINHSRITNNTQKKKDRKLKVITTRLQMNS